MRSSTETIVLCAIGYLAGSIAGSFLAGTASTHQWVVTWRLAVWILSAVIFAIHILVERTRRGSSPKVTAQRAASAVALGAFGVALAALTRGLVLHTDNSTRLGLALIIFPLAAGLPALVVAWTVAKLAPARASSRSELDL